MTEKEIIEIVSEAARPFKDGVLVNVADLPVMGKEAVQVMAWLKKNGTYYWRHNGVGSTDLKMLGLEGDYFYIPVSKLSED